MKTAMMAIGFVGALAAALAIFPETRNCLMPAANAEAKAGSLACSLDGAALQARRAGIMKDLFGKAQEVKELDNGYAVRFTGAELSTLFEFISSERGCCSFFEFTLKIEAENGPVWLTLAGREGVKEIVAAELAPVAKRLTK